ERRAARRERGADRAAEVDRAAARSAQSAREPAAEPPAELAHEVARLGDVARGELREGEREEPAAPGRPALALAAGGGHAGAAPRAAGARPLSLARRGGLRPRPRPPARRPRGAASVRSGAAARAPPPRPPALPVVGPTQRERLLEERVEDGAVRLVLHERRGERLAQHLALDARGRDRTHGVGGLGGRDLDAARAQAMDEVEEPLPHPRMLARHA